MAAFDALVLKQGDRDVNSCLPVDLLTGTGSDPRPRLRVDAAQTSFLEGRQFRVFHEFSIAPGASQWIRFTAPLDLVVIGRTLTVIQGLVRFALVTGGTPSGVWATKTVFPVNSMANKPAYVGQVTADVGGSLSGGSERDLMLLGTGVSNQAATVQASISEVGLGAGTYYVELRNTGSQNVVGLYQVLWEEYQPRSVRIY